MIKIIKGKDTKVVTQGVYNSLYKPLGYKPIEDAKKVAPSKPKVEEPKVKEPKVEEPKVEEEVKKESSQIKRRRGE